MPYKIIALAVVGLLIAAGIAALLIVGFSRSDSVGPKADLTVAATIFPLADIVRQIGGAHINVILVIPPGASEHSSDLSPQKISDLQQASLLFQIGHGLEAGLVDRLTAVLPAIRPVAVDTGIGLREFAGRLPEADSEANAEAGHESGVDPHYWLTVPNAQKMAATIADSLAEADPAHAAQYRQNLEQYQGQLASLEQDLQTQARTITQKNFIAMHDAWSYFADHYGLNLVATYEPIEGQEPSIDDLQELGRIIDQYAITAFYAEPQKTSIAAVNFMQQEFGLRILTLDPVGGTDKRFSYIDMMRENMASLAAGLLSGPLPAAQARR